MISRLTIGFTFASLALAGLLSGAACSSSGTGTTGTGGGGGSAGTGGPVDGPADTHCGTKSQVVNGAACQPATGAGGGGTGTSTGTSTGAGGAMGAGGAASEYGTTLPNAEGDDDDCKYHVKWTATSISKDADVTFTAVVTTKADGKPVAAGELDIEAFLTDTHPAPNSGTKITESPTGTYKLGPVKFDAAGKWTVRFHIHEECVDLTEDSPHGHVAFFVNVP
jgi:hypothetical protein